MGAAPKAVAWAGRQLRMTTRGDRANGGRGTGRPTAGVRLINLNRTMTLALYRMLNRGKDLAGEWRMENTQPREAYVDMAEYCFMASLPVTVVTTFVFIPLVDYTVGYQHLLARSVVYGLAPLPLICSFSAFVECQLRRSREPTAFDHGWTRKGYQTPARVDFITNPRVLLASSLGGIAAALLVGLLLGLWDPFSLA